MENSNVLKKYQRRMVRIGITKSLILGLILGFAVNTVVAFVTWFSLLSVPMVLIVSIGSGVLTATVAALIFYFKMFRPTILKVARVIDGLGLEERVITMRELEKDDSYIAKRQREDAKEKLSKVKINQLRYNLSKGLVAALIVLCIFGIAMTTVSGLAAGNVVEAGDVFMGGIFKDEEDENGGDPSDEDPGKELEYFTLTYTAGDHGHLEGSMNQKIAKGKNGRVVKAIADEGYMFVKWSDGVLTSNRWDLNVQGDITVEATFEKKGPTNEEEVNTPNGNEPDEGVGNEGGNKPSLQPDENGDTTGTGTPGMDSDEDYVIDGCTSYRDDFDYDKEMEEMTKDENLPDELKDIIGSYFDSLR